MPATRQTPAQVIANRAIAAAAASSASGLLFASLVLPYLTRFRWDGMATTGLFGSSPDYVPAPTIVSGPTIFFDSTGVAGNSGAAVQAPKPINELPVFNANGHLYYTAAANTKYSIGAGSVLPSLDAGGVGAGIFLGSAGGWYACHDSDPASRTYGQEVVDYNDPWYWATFFGMLPSAAYIAKRYFTVDGGCPPGAANLTGNGQSGVIFNNASSDKGVKGALIRNFQYAGTVGQGGANGKVLSCIIRDIQRNQVIGSDHNGNGIRWEGAFTDVTVAGSYLINCGGDQIWAASGAGEAGLKVTNNVITSTMPTAYFTSNHGDGIQTVGPMNGLVVQKNFIDLRADETRPPYINDSSTEQHVVCAAFRNNGTFGTPSIPAIFRDNVFATNDTCTQFQGMNNHIYERNLGFVRTNPQAPAAYSSPPQFWEQGGTLRDCVDVILGPGRSARSTIYLGTPTKVTSVEVVA